MFKRVYLTGIFIISISLSLPLAAVPDVTGHPVIVQHLGIIKWDQDTHQTTPFLTQGASNDINDLHGRLSCDLIISTPGNYHMALKDAMFGRPDLGHIGLLRQQGTAEPDKVSICWSTSPPVAEEQIPAESLQFKNITMIGRPAIAVAPKGVMDNLVTNGLVDVATRAQLLSNQGNVMLVRASIQDTITDICSLGGTTRVVTPHPDLEPGSFGNFSGTIFNIIDQNSAYTCDATTLFNEIFAQDISLFDLTVFNRPHNINGVMSVFGKGTRPQGSGAKWVASSRIMHRDIPYALCNNQADVGIIFYHQARYLRRTLAAKGCRLAIVPLGGTITNPQPVPGNRVGKLEIAKVTGSFPVTVLHARDKLYDFFTTDPMWETILNSHGILR